MGSVSAWTVCENSDVLPSGESVAVAEMKSEPVVAALRTTSKLTVPLAPVVTVVKPR